MLRRLYKNHSSGFRDWNQRDHASQYLLYPDHVGPDISIDEVSLSRGELYTIVANKQAKGRKGSTIAIIQGTRVADLVSRLELLPLELRNQVRQVSMDMAANMKSAVQQVFAQASIVTDRFHVVRLVNECVQQARVKLRRQQMDAENRAMIQARADKKRYVGEEFATAANSVSNHRDTILNFFDHRATNANAESFNAKIKMFRAIQKGVRDVPFFLFRLEKLFA